MSENSITKRSGQHENSFLFASKPYFNTAGILRDTYLLLNASRAFCCLAIASSTFSSNKLNTPLDLYLNA